MIKEANDSPRTTLKPPFDGILLIDKPKGCTSHDVVRRLRQKLNMKAIGHAGTLDPLATGLLVTLLGEATCLSSDLLNKDKGYHAKIRLGIETDTWDREGETLKENSTLLDPKIVLAEAQKLVGDLELPIPLYSAVKKNGKKLYEYAREGKEITIPKRTMSFYNIKTRMESPSLVHVEMNCTKGSFVRSWAYQLGLNLGVGACIEELRRVYSSPYKVQEAVTLDELPPLVSPYFQSLNDYLSSYQTLTLTGRNEHLMINGQIPIEVTQRLTYQQKQANQLGCQFPIRVISGQNGHLLSLLNISPFQGVKIKKIFNARHKNP